MRQIDLWKDGFALRHCGPSGNEKNQERNKPSVKQIRLVTASVAAAQPSADAVPVIL
jgi:hypothetical protein